MKGAETQVDMVIGAPTKPSSVQWIEGIFSATLVPVMQITATSDTSYEFWYAGETPLTGDIVNQAQFLGRSTQWVLNGLKADTTYYAYVRTRNAFGTSDFVEASGKASSEIPGMLDFIDQGIRDSGAFKNLQTISETSIEAILQNGMAIDASVEHQWAQYGEVRADVLHITTTIADVEKAFAEYQTIVQAQFDSTIAQVNQKLTASVTSEGTASAYYDLGLQIVRNDVAYKTGVSMGIEPDGSGYKSTIVFAADQFGIYSGNNPASWQAAFFVQQGQVFMNSAFIQDASITNAKIGEYIQSNDFVSGSTGWRIDKSGNAEFSNATVRGTVYATDGSFTGTVYAKDGMFTGVVEATAFVGDVAVQHVMDTVSAYKAYSDGPQSASTSRTYTDNARVNLAKTVTVSVAFTSAGSAVSQGSVTDYSSVTVNIGGNSRSFGIGGMFPDTGIVIPGVVQHSVSTYAATVPITVSAYVDRGAYTHTRYITIQPVISVTRNTNTFT